MFAGAGITNRGFDITKEEEGITDEGVDIGGNARTEGVGDKDDREDWEE
jgi:hypothetical protein